MENACLQESDRQVELEDSVIAWQDKYDRLYESHKRVQKVNQNLEDKLLKLVDRNSGERAQLTSDVATLSVRLAQANYNIQSLKREIERYKTDMSVAIQLLQCKPDSFVSPKLSSLPIEIQSKVATYMRLDTNSHSDSEGSTSGVGMATASSYHVLPASDSPPPMCPFPPTAMVYSMRGLGKYVNQSSSQDGGGGGGGGTAGGGGSCGKLSSQHETMSLGNINSSDSFLGTVRGSRNDHNVVSPSVMAKFLEDELKSSEALLNSPVKHCETCVCTRNTALNSGSLILADLLGDGQKYYNVGTQTVIKGETNNSLCLRCNNNLNSPSHHNSPYIMKLIKSSDSVISETKSSVSDFLTTPDKTSPNGGSGNQELLQPIKKDDLMVNPILGHHRINERCGTYTSPNSDPPGSFGLNKSNNLAGSKSGKLTLITHSKKPVDAVKSVKAQSTIAVPMGGKYTNESPSYIIKDTDQMSGSHTLQTPKSSVGGGGGEIGSLSGPGKISSGGPVGSGLYHAIGSTNSLWSRTSSRERDGAKIFENFNRNLIKTIKAENPKMSGPRICALRIQNGSSNILLDNLQDDVLEECVDSKQSVAPVIYTRRAKFLDEELLLDDDPSIGLNGAIKTTSLPTAISSIQDSSSESKQIPTIANVPNGVITSAPIAGNNAPEGMNNDGHMSTTTSLNSSDRLCTIGEEINNLILNTKMSSNVVTTKPRPDINVNKLEGIDMNSKKSCTQSSSISSEIDIQESAMLRRQQLSRVAEWVQNNSKIANPEHLSNTESDNENLALASATSLTIADSINNNNNGQGIGTAVDSKDSFTHETKLVVSDLKISHSNSSNSMAQPTRSDNIHSNSNSHKNNHIIVTSNSNSNNIFAQPCSNATMRGHTSLKAAIASNVSQLDYNSNNYSNYNTKSTGSRQPIYTGSKHSLLDCSRQQQQQQQQEELTLSAESQLRPHMEPGDQDDSNSVDLAQMEYNVKQFLLKQNEWSSLSRKLSSATTTTGKIDQQHPIADESSANKMTTAERPITFGSVRSSEMGVRGSFPGTAVAQTPQFHMQKYTINPHRTETNL
ncbi:putative uncharacterized protein DDB_G0277255 isoform X3 [Toxorhynchites rutilus septentrionalis]|nr:putative uncharacterized protein DDB_G0277255 isoform X3 [Toxorhynchites rutilus septentrionalis]